MRYNLTYILCQQQFLLFNITVNTVETFKSYTLLEFIDAINHLKEKVLQLKVENTALLIFSQ